MDTDDNQKIKQDLKQAMDDLDQIKDPKKDKVRKDIQRVSDNLHRLQIDQKLIQERKEKAQRKVERKYYTNGKVVRNVGYVSVGIIVIAFVTIWLVET